MRILIISLMFLSACGAATPSPPEPNSPGALVYRGDEAREQATAAAAELGRIQRAERAATANAQATDRAIMQRATATEQAFILAQRQAEAHATQEAVALAATANAQQAAQTAQAASARATQSALEARATADAREIAQAIERRAATATAQAIDLAQQAAEHEARLARRNAELYAVVTPIIILIIVCALVILAVKFIVQWMDARAYRQKLENLHLALLGTLAETRIGTIQFVGDESKGYTAHLLQAPSTPPNHDTPSEARAVDAEVETVKVVTAKGTTYIARHDPQHEATEANRRVAMKVLRAAMQQVGGQSSRIPRYSDLGLSAETWQRAIDLLRPYLVVKQGGGGGTYCGDTYPTLLQLCAAVGERRIRLTTPPPHAEDVPQAANVRPNVT